MKILILSDTHFGFGKGSERESDPFEYAEQAIKEEKADIILLGGDIFDAKIPDPETFVRAFRLFMERRPGNSANISGLGKNLQHIPKSALIGTPIIGIHGTHERRVKGLLNPIEALEKMGVLIHLHANGVVVEKDGEKVCIQGLSSVPDNFAETILEDWRPKPVKDCFNVFLLHQSIEGFTMAEHLLPREKIPEGFDLYVLGHIHSPERTVHSGSPMIVTGSAIPTQIKKEYIKPAGYWTIDTKKPDPVFTEFKNQRRAYIVEGGKEKIEKEIEKILSEGHAKRPIIKIISADNIEKEMNIKYGARALLIFQKKAEKMEMERVGLEEHRLSVQELGRKILLENLKKAGLDQKVFEEVFELFSEKKTEEAVETIRKPLTEKKMVVDEGVGRKGLGMWIGR